ncbi:MAG: hypothetical protein Q7S57_02670 [bacterium]|nr:hypothetical protein [bacterium]
MIVDMLLRVLGENPSQYTQSIDKWIALETIITDKIFFVLPYVLFVVCWLWVIKDKRNGKVISKRRIVKVLFISVLLLLVGFSIPGIYDGILLAGGIDSAYSIPTPESYEPYVEPDSVLGFSVSPNVTFEIIDPDGKILSREKNELGEDNANFDDDPSDPDDIILVTIRNPKVGKYTLKLTGNTAGDYYVDSTYVNDNGVFDDENTGTIKKEEEKTLEATVSETAGVDLPANETDKGSNDITVTDDNNTTENKTGDSSGPNTAKIKTGTVLGTATVRVKLS